jgi:hypothetical protein
VCVVYLIWHEVAQVARQHFALLKQAQGHSGRGSDEPDDAAVRRALEFDADLFAAQLLLFTALGELETAHQTTRDTGFHWIGYAVAMGFGLYDSRRKALNLYSESDYPHPIIRRQLFSDFAATYIRINRLDLVDTWRAQERAGWLACVTALRHMDVEALSGSFGGAGGATHRFAPVIADVHLFRFDGRARRRRQRDR